jgi:histidinol-phosphate phosphatase family domain/HAD-superfamily hydrolase, subfamily IIIA
MHHDSPTHPARPRQAVILAGGQGTRLRPFSDLRPKPMIEIHGVPFLEHIVVMLREQGFTDVVMLLGYLPEIVTSHFGDGSRWGLRIRYSVTAAEHNTGRRLKLAARLLEEHFFLLYCDNYWPMQADRMWRRFLEAGAPAMLTVYTNKDGWTKNSILLDEQGFITAFDKRNQTPGLQGVEISYAIFHRSILSRLPEHDNVPLEETVFPVLAANRQLAAFVTDHRYYSVGSVARLPFTETFLARRPAIILDRDGVLNRKPARACYVRSWAEWEWMPGSIESLVALREAGYRVIVVSNQAGINRRAMTEAELHAIHRRMSKEVTVAGGHIDAIYFCPHDWDEGCECRKPKPGMLFQAQRDFSLDLTRTWFVGDDERDAIAADAAGCRSYLVGPHRPLLPFIQDLLETSFVSTTQ